MAAGEGSVAGETEAAAEAGEALVAGETADPEMPQLDEQTEITGALLAQARQARGLTLDDYVRVTKISIYYLRNIEQEVVDDLPAAVYVRGYLRQMAEMLGLDAHLVAQGYLARIEKLLAAGKKK